MRKIPMDMIAGTVHTTKRNGDISIIKYLSYENVRVKFLETGNESVVRSDHVRKGEVRDKLRPSVHGAGYFGYGDYASTGSHKRAYKTWCGMLSRCYKEDFLSKNKTYIGCTVCKEWLCYQTFAEWYMDNYPDDGVSYDLDKDIKIDGNKIYSPDTCIFVTPSDNCSKAMGTYGKKWILSDKRGQLFVVHNQSEFCRVHGLNTAHLSSVISGKRASHKGWVLVNYESLTSML